MNENKLSVYMIVKNESELIERAIKSVQGADELVIVDTGSEDNTVEIAKKYTDKVYTDYKWCDDFSSAKNYAASKCSGDWLMSLDADLILEEGGMEKIKDIISRTKYFVVNVWLEPKKFPGMGHRRGKIYRNNGQIFYTGKVHENLNIEGVDDDKGVLPKIIYDYSPSHKKDPERNIRILKAELENKPDSPRLKFYLGNEYYDRRRYNEAIATYLEYVKISKWAPEKADAYVKLAECYWYTNRGDQAREMCGKAILINPDFSFALRLMSTMHHEPLKSKWKEIASIAKDKNVLFKK